MAKQGFRIAKEIKDEIINKLKHEGLSVMDAAKSAIQVVVVEAIYTLRFGTVQLVHPVLILLLGNAVKLLATGTNLIQVACQPQVVHQAFKQKQTL